MEKFAELTLDDLAEITSSKRIYLSDYVESGIPFFRSKEIIERFNNQETSVELFISEKKFDEIKNRFGAPMEGDILITSVGTLGIPYLVKKDDIFYFKDGNLIWFRNFKEGISSKFLFHWLCSELGKKSLLSYSIGSSQPAFTIENTKKVKIQLPRIETQKKIAAVLSAYDDLIENNKRRIALLEKMAEEIYREWFVRMRFPGYKEAKFEKGVPVGWGIVELSELAEINKSNLKRGHEPETILYIDIGSVTTNQINDILEVEYKKAPGRARRIVKHGDIIWSSVRPANRAYSLIYEPHQNLIVSTGFAVISPKENFPYSYLYFAVTNNSFVDQMTMVAKGSAYPATSFDDFKKAKVFLPNGNLLSEFGKVCESLFKKKHLLLTENDLLINSRNLLLSRLISGKLSVENLDIKFPPSMREDEEKEETAYA